MTDWICVTGEGIDKSHDFVLEQADIELITQKAKESLSKQLEAGK